MSRDELLSALGHEMPGYVGAAVRFNVAVADRIGMSVADLQCLNSVVESGTTSAGELARRVGLTSGAMTRMIDRLESSGYLRRVPDPTDRRRVLVELVPAKLASIAHHFEPMGRLWQEQLSGYTDEQLAFLVDFLRYGREFTDAEAARLRAEGR
jgi:DNA-binding MarR family transcriptional regulator